MSGAAEGHAAASVLRRAKQDGMNIALHWQDDSSSASQSFRVFFPDAKIMLCGGNATRTHQSMFKNLQKKRIFTQKDEKMNELSLKNCDLLL